MSQEKQLSTEKNHHYTHHHEHSDDHHHHHHDSHDHHHHDRHHDSHDHHHHHHPGDDYQNEFDIYPEQFLKIFADSNGMMKVLDIREEWEREQIYITGSLSIQMQKLIGSFNQLDPNETYYILCSQGFRSSFAGRYLLSQGFRYIHSVQTGIFGIYEYANKNHIKLDWLQVAPDFDLRLQ